MDYRELLKRYMRHVQREEGSTFLPNPYCDIGELSAADIAELERLDAEAFPNPPDTKKAPQPKPRGQ